jgi:hypothetical protein
MNNYNIERHNFITDDSTLILNSEVTVFNKIDVNVLLDLDEGFKFWFIRNNNSYEYELKGFLNNFKAKLLTIDWIETIRDHKGTLINSSFRTHNEYNTPFYEQFNVSSPSPYFHIKQCLNKIMENEIKTVCFNQKGIVEVKIIK